MIGLAFLSLMRSVPLTVQRFVPQSIFGAHNGCDIMRSRYLPDGSCARSSLPLLSVLNCRTTVLPFSSSTTSPGIGEPEGSFRMPLMRCEPSNPNCFEVPQSAAKKEFPANRAAHSAKVFMLGNRSPIRHMETTYQLSLSGDFTH